MDIQSYIEDDIKDYRIDVRVKSNRIFKLIQMKGYKSVSEFCTKNKMPYQSTINYINLKDCPIGKDNKWKGSAVALANALGMHEEILWTEEQQTAEIESTSFEVTTEQAKALVNSNLVLSDKSIDIEEKHLLEERVKETNSHIDKSLTPREARIIKMRYGIIPYKEAHTLQQIADVFEVSRARIREIEHKAKAKMRYKKEFNDF